MKNRQKHRFILYLIMVIIHYMALEYEYECIECMSYEGSALEL